MQTDPSQTLNPMSNSSLSSFRNFAREIRKPMPYRLGVSEGKGLLNIVIGVGQLLVCPCLKLFKAQKLYEVHLEAGKTALKQGAKDLTPAITLSAITLSAITLTVVVGVSLTVQPYI